MDVTARNYGGVPVEQRRANRRERLLAAATELFASTGFHATRIERICTMAGTSTKNFYEEFPNKETVLLLLHDRINTAAHIEVSAALEALPGHDLSARIRTLLTTYLGSVTADPRLPRVNFVAAVGASDALEHQRTVWIGRWAALIAEEADRAARSHQAPERDYRLISIGLVGAATGLLRDWQAQPAPLPVEEIIQALHHIFLAAIGR